MLSDSRFDHTYNCIKFLRWTTSSRWNNVGKGSWQMICNIGKRIDYESWAQGLVRTRRLLVDCRVASTVRVGWEATPQHSTLDEVYVTCQKPPDSTQPYMFHHRNTYHSREIQIAKSQFSIFLTSPTKQKLN